MTFATLLITIAVSATVSFLFPIIRAIHLERKRHPKLSPPTEGYNNAAKESVKKYNETLQEIPHVNEAEKQRTEKWMEENYFNNGRVTLENQQEQNKTRK